MTLDLDDVLQNWDCPPGEMRARVVMGRDGQELVQLRIDLGLMQMFARGRPDGERYHGLPSAREYIVHEQRIGGRRVLPEDWKELERELVQTNYRRMALASVAEDAMRHNDVPTARHLLEQALEDIETCIASLAILRRARVPTEHRLMRPSLYFDRARLKAQLAIMDGRFEDAIELAEAGASVLGALLDRMGCTELQREQDPGMRYLVRMSRQLRQEYGIAQTLREQLEAAVESEDYETAAQLRDELRQRRRQRRSRRRADPEGT